MILKSPQEEEAVRRMQKIYLDAERKIVAEITRKRSLGYVDYAEVASLERVQAILTKMQDDTFTYAPVMVETIFHGQGEKNAAGYANARALTATQTAVVQTLVNNLLGEILEVSETAYNSAREYLTVGRLEGQTLRSAALEAVASQEAIGASWTMAQKQMTAELMGKGITGFIDKAGRKWSLTDYCNMAVRTTAKQAAVASILTEDDYDLWQIVKIGTTCPVCAVYEGRVYSKSGTNPDYPPLASAFGKIDPEGANNLENTYLNIHPNCLVPGGAILAEGVMAESRRRYSGEVITLETASGNKITVTPNHPILTTLGFVPACEIVEGQEVIEAAGEYGRLLGEAPNNINVPTRVDEKFHAFMKSVSGSTHRVKGSSVQFHGDGGTDSEVNIILPDSFRVSEGKGLIREPLGKKNFPTAHGRRIFLFTESPLLKIFKGALSSLNGFVSRLGFISGVKGIAIDGKQFADLRQRTPTGFSNLGISHSLVVKFKKFIELIPMGFFESLGNIIKAFVPGSAFGEHDLEVIASRADGLKRNSELLCNLAPSEPLVNKRLNYIGRNNGLVVSVLTHKSTSFYDGYVYNLQTKHEFYVYNNIVTHNCLHSLVKYTTIGKTEKQIQKDKDFSSFEKNPITHDPRTKKQREAYQKKMRDRQKLVNDTHQWKRYKAVLGNECPGWDDFIKHKQAGDDVYKSLESKFRSFSIKASKQSSLFEIGEGSGLGKMATPKEDWINPLKEYEQNKPAIMKTLNSVETESRFLKHERTSVIDRTGKLIYQNDGNRNKVEIPNEIQRDNVITHNHPGGGCFSAGDVDTLISHGALELRASTPHGTVYSLLRTGNVPQTRDFYNDYKKEISRDHVFAEVFERIRAGEIADEVSSETLSKIKNDFARDFLRQNADKYGYKFTEGTM